MPIDFNLLGARAQQPQQQGQQGPQQGSSGINFGMLTPQPQPKQGIIAQLAPPAPSGDSGGGLGGLLDGLKGIMGMGARGNSQTSSEASNAAINQSTQLSPSSYQGQQQSPGINPAYSPISPNQSLNDLYKRPAFQTALQAQQTSLKSGITKSPIMTVVDYSVPANQPRMWVVDTQQNKVLMNTYVAQGATPGFSNNPGSHQSSLGTFLTGDTYHSDSMNRDAMRIQGEDKGVNDNAFARGIVVHGGNYVGPDKQGTSWGCFAVPNGDAPKLIGLTKGGTIIHAYAPDNKSMNSFAKDLNPAGAVSLHNQMNSSNMENLPYYNNGKNHMENLPYNPNQSEHLQQLSGGNQLTSTSSNSFGYQGNNTGYPRYQDLRRSGDGVLSPPQRDFPLNNTYSKQGMTNNMSSQQTLDTIKKFEGFEPTAKWDVNAYRNGYGSDTITRPDGSVHKVTQGMPVSRDDAERDLARRAQEFENTATNQVGHDNWRQLSPGAQSALTSVAYNYGSLPKSVVAAVKTGSPAVIAGAVRALGGANKGVNRQRRNLEASMIVAPIGPQTMNTRQIPNSSLIRNMSPESVDALMKSQASVPEPDLNNIG